MSRKSITIDILPKIAVYNNIDPPAVYKDISEKLLNAVGADKVILQENKDIVNCDMCNSRVTTYVVLGSSDSVIECLKCYDEQILEIEKLSCEEEYEEAEKIGKISMRLVSNKYISFGKETEETEEEKEILKEIPVIPKENLRIPNVKSMLVKLPIKDEEGNLLTLKEKIKLLDKNGNLDSKHLFKPK